MEQDVYKRQEQAFLDIPVERSIELGVSQLIFMVFVLGGDLLEPVYGFVIGGFHLFCELTYRLRQLIKCDLFVCHTYSFLIVRWQRKLVF